MTSRDRPDITKEMVDAFWNNLPSPYEIDIEKDAAARRTIAAILKAQAKSQLR